MRIARASIIVVALVLSALGAVSAAPALTVFAASDLAFAFKDLVPAFERATGARVTLVLGSTGNFAHQIDAGAPADVFFAANAEYVDALAAKDRVIASTRTLYAQGRIVLAAPRRGPKLTGLEQLTDPAVRKIAIGNPRHAPYGKAAEQALRAAGVWDAVRPKLVYGENIRHALQFIQTGAVDAGIVALSISDVPEITFVPIDAKLHAPLNQLAAVVRRSRAPGLAQAFITFVMGPEGRPVMKRYGFVVPGEL